MAYPECGNSSGYEFHRSLSQSRNGVSYFSGKGPTGDGRLSAAQREQALAIPEALATHDRAQALAVLRAAGVEPDYVEVADFDGPTLALAARIGDVRLIDNVLVQPAVRSP